MASDLPDHTEVWRYMDMWKFMSLLETSNFYFSRLDTLEDPFDGQLRPYELPYARSLVLHALKDNQSAKERFEAKGDKLLRQGATSRLGPVFVSCWHVAKHSSIAMWKLYCPSGQGVAIVSTVGQLRELSDVEPALVIGKVEYESVKRLGRVDKWEELPFLKRREYEFEREVRMVIRYPLEEHLASDLDEPGVCLPIELADVVRKVWIPAGGTAWQQSALANVITKLGLKVEIGRSRLLDDYWGDEARIGNAMLMNQLQQLDNPDSRIMLSGAAGGAALFSLYANAPQGLKTGDDNRFRRFFWECAPSVNGRWRRYQSTPNGEDTFSGMENVIDWFDNGQSMARLQGETAWGKQGMAVGQMRSLPVGSYCGDIQDSNVNVILPKRTEHAAALAAYVQSEEFKTECRKLDQKIAITNATMVKVPFDLDHWQKVADERYSEGLPEPHSDDPTQWLFRGDIPSSKDPIQVAVAKLLGYQWPDQPEGPLDACADEDGIVTLAPLVNQDGIAGRLRALLQSAYESEAPARPKGAPEPEEPRIWKEAVIPNLLAKSGSTGMSFEEWLRDKFFDAHTKLFQQRPFIWHIWDGRKDGFHAFVNYHKLDRKNLERLTHVYLGEWIERQRAASESGDRTADARLIAAQELQRKLELIRTGEPPYDIFVRWKSLADQPMGWDPDINDGVRMNIRPFVEAGVLRGKVSVNWNKDRGKDPKPNVSGTVERHNDLHFTLAEKRAAREAAG